MWTQCQPSVPALTSHVSGLMSQAFGLMSQAFGPTSPRSASVVSSATHPTVVAMQNVEVKFELRDPPLLRTLLGAMHATQVATLQQVDTYYRLADGRLKKRETLGQPVEFIFYHRENQAKARLSQFTIYSAAEAAQYFGTTEPPVWVVVSKTREVLMIDGVRVHIDHVKDLGWFLEFEALVSPAQNLVKCYAAVDRLKKAFGPALGEPLSVSYSDLLAAEA